MGDLESLMMLISTRLARSYGMVTTRARGAFPRRFQGRHPIVQSLGIVILLQYHARVSTSKRIKAIPEIAGRDLERGYWLTSGSPCRTMIRHLIRHQKSSHRVGDLGRSLLVGNTRRGSLARLRYLPPNAGPHSKPRRRTQCD